MNSIPIGPTITMKQNVVYAMPSALVVMTSGQQIQGALLEAGPFVNLFTGMNVVEPFVRCAVSDATIKLRKTKFAEL